MCWNYQRLRELLKPVLLRESSQLVLLLLLLLEVLPGLGMGIVVSDGVTKIAAIPATINAIATMMTNVRFIITY
jgi:hypothetical protein